MLFVGLLLRSRALLEWLDDPLGSLLTGSCSTTDLGNTLAFLWEAPPVSILFEKTRHPVAQDLDFISMIVQDRSSYIEAAVKFLLDDLKSHPASEIDVGEPRLIFRLNGVWEVHFHSALPNETEGLGVLVVFKGELPECVQILDEVETWYDSDGGEFLPL